MPMTTVEPVKKILLYVDGSEECIAAAQYGIALAKRTGAELNAVYIVNVSMLQELTKARIFVKIEEMDYEQDLEQDGKRYLNYISEMARAKDVPLRAELFKVVSANGWELRELSEEKKNLEDVFVEMTVGNTNREMS